MPLPVAGLVTNVAFLYIGGPGIIVLRYVVPVAFAALPGDVRARLKVRVFGSAPGAFTTPGEITAG